MGSFVAEAGTDVSVGGGERAKSGESNYGVGAKPGELAVRPGEGHENQGLGNKSGEPDYVYKSNGNPDSHVHENGDGDLPSFSIKRLRRLPLRVACEQQPPPSVDRSRPDDGNVVETVEQRQTLSGPGGVDAAHSSGGFSDLSRRGDDVVVPREEGTDTIAEVEPELENGKHIIGEAELRNLGGGEEAGFADGPDLSFGRVSEMVPPGEEKQTGNDLDQEKQEGNVFGQEKQAENVPGQEKQAGNGLGQEEQAGNDLGQEISEKNKDLVAAPEHALDRSNTLIAHSSAPEVQVDNHLRENASPGTSDSPSPSAGLESVAENMKDVSSALAEGDPNRDTLTEEKGKVAEETNLVVSTELPSPGIVQILPPVMGSRFESPGETTDEETDSPRSSEGFAYPDPDAMAFPYSGQIMYPSRFSSAQTSNGPSLLQYSGSMSLRSDSSTTSNRSFAFPILAPPEWNSSPVRMAKAHPRRKNRFEGCCFFSLSRIRNKY